MNHFRALRPPTGLFIVIASIVLFALGFMFRSTVMGQCNIDGSMATFLICQTARSYMSAYWLICATVFGAGVTLTFLSVFAGKVLSFGHDDTGPI